MKHTTESLIGIYDNLYKIQGKKAHPRKVRDGKPVMIGKYGMATSRNPRFMAFLENIDPKPVTVHDAGCGRGSVLTELLSRGYKATGSDCAESLFSQELKDLPAKCITYDNLREYGEDQFDAVISNDVLEHLVDENAVDRAISNLHFIAKDWLLFSVGTRHARNYPSTHRLGISDLHQVQHDGGWWRSKFEPYMEEVYHLRTRVNWFQFGRKRRS